MANDLETASVLFRNAMREAFKKHSTWYLIQGALLVVAGMLAIIYPLMSAVAVVVLIGWLLMFSGIIQAISLIGAKHAPHFWLQLISAILAILVGFLFVREPGQGLVTLTLLLIIFFMIEGVSKIVFALTIRPMPQWGWVLASGLVGVILSVLLLAFLKVTAIWLVGLMLGVQLISIGAAIANMAWQARKS
ncbi:HdeD family acid-resistance protein [Rhizobium sp. TH2]|uniref:HdeD family acid-resistance protein n=1 Tax=Rhizobium sp. TH2 TaxID=2775403 RepID=UPI002157F7AD|nr:HdeD family acid-resistance protein [Rhizobium sp. TH2]UVC11264.1 HdeD family acid-resistance protein [Rhizobium sp. TH2]